MNRPFILISFILICCYSPAQKVVVLRSPLTLAPTDRIYVMQQSVRDSGIAYSRNSKGDFVIPAQGDSIYICGVDEYWLQNNGEDMRYTQKPPVYLFRHLGTVAADTISISGIEFHPYFYKQNITGLGNGKTRRDSTTGNLSYCHDGYTGPPFAHTIPVPQLTINKASTRHHIAVTVQFGDE